jgi:energy-coupling factor transport system substrate-specific component
VILVKTTITSSLIFFGAISRVLMAGMPNIEPVMLVTLVSGVKYGWKYGLLTGLLTMAFSDLLIYGTIPYFALSMSVSFIALTGLMTNVAYGLVGALSGFFKKHTKRVELAGAALLLTIIYDLVTNVGTAFIANITVVQALLQGIPFMFLHLLGNVLIVTICAPYLLKVIAIVESTASSKEPKQTAWGG